MTYRFEFDQANKILLLRFEGRRLTDELGSEIYWAIKQYSTATNAGAGIWDFSAAIEFALSPEFIRGLADREPAMPDAAKRPRFFVAPATVGLGMSRLFEIAVGDRNPLFKIVHSVEDAFVALGLQSPQFEPLG